MANAVICLPTYNEHENLERMVRAYAPWPGTFLDLPDGRLVVTSASVAPSAPEDAPGAIVRAGSDPALATADGRQTFTRSGIFAYDLSTGTISTTFAPGLGGPMRRLTTTLGLIAAFISRTP